MSLRLSTSPIPTLQSVIQLVRDVVHKLYVNYGEAAEFEDVDREARLLEQALSDLNNALRQGEPNYKVIQHAVRTVNTCGSYFSELSTELDKNLHAEKETSPSMAVVTARPYGGTQKNMLSRVRTTIAGIMPALELLLLAANASSGNSHNKQIQLQLDNIIGSTETVLTEIQALAARNNQLLSQNNLLTSENSRLLRENNRLLAQTNAAINSYTNTSKPQKIWDLGLGVQSLLQKTFAMNIATHKEVISLRDSMKDIQLSPATMSERRTKTEEGFGRSKRSSRTSHTRDSQEFFESPRRAAPAMYNRQDYSF